MINKEDDDSIKTDPSLANLDQDDEIRNDAPQATEDVLSLSNVDVVTMKTVNRKSTLTN